MRNRFHLVIKTPNVDLVERMRWLSGSHRIRLNHRHKTCEQLVVTSGGQGNLGAAEWRAKEFKAGEQDEEVTVSSSLARAKAEGDHSQKTLFCKNDARQFLAYNVWLKARGWWVAE
jgi:hypothetical protein